MKMGIVINTNDPESAWNALRFGLTAILKGHEARVFLMSKGVEVEELKHPTFDVQKVLKDFIEAGGELIACGTCLKVRKKEGSFELCPIGIMDDFVKFVEDNDKVVVFG